MSTEADPMNLDFLNPPTASAATMDLTPPAQQIQAEIESAQPSDSAPTSVSNLTDEPSNDLELSDALPTPWRSPVLRRWESSGRSVPSTACSQCEAAVWMVRAGNELLSFCRVMHLASYPSEDLEDCDGPEMAKMMSAR